MIFFLGDVHGRFTDVNRHVLPARPTAVVFLGDIEPARPFVEEIAPLEAAGIAVYWIRGNHDTDSRTSWNNLAGAMDRNIDGRVVDIGGVRVAGLGGVFRGEIWFPDHPAMCPAEPKHRNFADYCRACEAKRPLRERNQQATGGASYFGRDLKHESSIFSDTYDALTVQEADILVTHEAPSCHSHGFKTIDHLAQAMGIKRLFHGHHHDCINYRAWDAELGFQAFGVAFRGITDMHGTIIFPGEDHARFR